jgi:hypothetical protein
VREVKKRPGAEGEKPGARSQKPEGEKKGSGRVRVLAFSSGFWLLAPGFFLPGCSTSTRETPAQRSENAERDPFGYSPKFERTDVSGGGWLDYDKEGMRKDLKNVLDP